MARRATGAGRRGRGHASGWAAVIASVLIATSAPAGQGGGQGGGPGSVLRYGMSVSAVSDVNPNDALAASLVFARGVGQAVGAWTDAKAVLFEDSESMVKAVNAGETDLVAMSTMEYLTIERNLQADPFVLYQTAGQVQVEYLLLVHDQASSIADLARKRVAIHNPSNQRDLADTWLDVLLMEAGLPDSARALQQVRVVKKRSQAAMSLFFDQVDAAVETRSAFDTAAELNPQLGKALKVLARSPRLLPGIVCVRRSMPADLKRRYLEKAVAIHENTRMSQTFVVLRINRLVPFEPGLLDDTRALAARYLALRRKAAAR